MPNRSDGLINLRRPALLTEIDKFLVLHYFKYVNESMAESDTTRTIRIYCHGRFTPANGDPGRKYSEGIRGGNAILVDLKGITPRMGGLIARLEPGEMNFCRSDIRDFTVRVGRNATDEMES